MDSLVASGSPMSLEDGSRVAVVGGGPAGSLFAYFLLSFADRLDLALELDIFEPRDFAVYGPAGCNMCGGVVSESLVQALALEGIDLPESLVQRGIESYVLHTGESSLAIGTPLGEKRIAAIHRGGGPRDAEAHRWGGFDGYLLDLAQRRGARVLRARVNDAGRGADGRPEVRLKGATHRYDLLVGATGVNSSTWPLFEKLGLPSRPPRTAKTYVTELRIGQPLVSRYFGNAMHMFLLDIPKLDCAAMIPKGDHVTVCLLGSGIDAETIEAFFQSDPVRRCMPPDATACPGNCHCGPRINEREAAVAFADRVVLVGDCGVSRLYKDGIGAAYRTAKAAARTAAFAGVAEADFHANYAPLYRSIARDNRYGALMFEVMHLMKVVPALLKGAVGMAAREQATTGAARRMSLVLWDMFTGSAPYRDIFLRTLDPRFIGGFAWETARALVGRGNGHALDQPARGSQGPEGNADYQEAGMSEGVLGRDYSDGELLCRQGEEGDRMFVIQQGRAEVLVGEGGQEVLVGELGPGDIFGEMAVVDKRPRSASVRAKGRARILTLDKRAFLRRVHEDPTLAYRMLEGLSGKVRRLDEELSLLRNAVQVQMVRHVYVVPKDKPELLARLKREFAADPEVEVVLDRREGERRKEGAGGSPERRLATRRAEPDEWSVCLSQPFRRDRGRVKR